jgi:hypothetical protein
MKLVILESPYRGATAADTERNVRYAHAAMLDSLRRGESPLASHLLWPGILDDADPFERALGIEAGLEWGRVAEATVVYGDLGISEGMQQGIDRAHKEGRLVEYRRMPGHENEKGGP